MPSKRKHHHTKKSTRRMRKGRSRKTGGNILSIAAVPFGLLSLQKLFHSRKKTMSKRRHL